MKWIGEAPRLFSASEASSRSSARVSGCMTTFSRIVPKRCVVAWISGSASADRQIRSEEHTSELQSLMRISYAVFCLKKKKLTHLLVNNVYNHNDEYH